MAKPDPEGRRHGSRVDALLRRVPGWRELWSMTAVAVAHAGARMPPDPGSGFVSDESPVIIAGAHRSGTSLVTRLLERGEMFVGGRWVDEHHESYHFSRANRAMLGEGVRVLRDFGWTAPKSAAFIAARRGYAERAARRAHLFFADRGEEIAWGWKDPRNCLTLPVWLSIYPAARVLHVIRDGRAVALSLADRDGLDPAFGLALWACYLERAEVALRGLGDSRKFAVRYEDLVLEPEQRTGAMFEFCGLSGDAAGAAASLIDSSRMHVRRRDPRFSSVGTHPTLERYGYR